MNGKENNRFGGQKRNKVTKALYIVAAVIAVFGIVMLADNIYIFKSTLDQYTTQGYPLKTVLMGLLPQQMLPGILEPIALYGGIACALFGIGNINKKVFSFSDSQSENEDTDQIIGEENAIGDEGAEENPAADKIVTEE